MQIVDVLCVCMHANDLKSISRSTPSSSSPAWSLHISMHMLAKSGIFIVGGLSLIAFLRAERSGPRFLSYFSKSPVQTQCRLPVSSTARSAGARARISSMSTPPPRCMGLAGREGGRTLSTREAVSSAHREGGR